MQRGGIRSFAILPNIHHM